MPRRKPLKPGDRVRYQWSYPGPPSGRIRRGDTGTVLLAPRDHICLVAIDRKDFFGHSGNQFEDTHYKDRCWWFCDWKLVRLPRRK